MLFLDNNLRISAVLLGTELACNLRAIVEFFALVFMVFRYRPSSSRYQSVPHRSPTFYL